MDWLIRMNGALEYIENNLREDIDLKKAASTACCSLSHFQRLFSFIAGIPLSEYVRNRRLTLAGYDLKTTRARIVDLAIRYGYDSPEAFTRAFRLFHGMSPSLMRRPENDVRCYPRAAFQAMVKGGGVFMGTKALMRIDEARPGRVVSFGATGKDPESTAWEALRRWAVRNLTDCACRKCIGHAPRGHHPDGEGSDRHAYAAQMYLVQDEGEDGTFLGARVEKAPEGLFMISDVPLEITDGESGEPDIGESMKRTSQIMYECMKTMGGYELDFDGRFFYEETVFTGEWFEGMKKNPEFKLWLPIRKTGAAGKK